MKTIELLDKALRNADTDRIFIVTQKEAGVFSFAQYIGAVNANGKYGAFDAVPCGTFIYFEDNERPSYAEIPDAIFTDNEGCKIGFWDYAA